MLYTIYLVHSLTRAHTFLRYESPPLSLVGDAVPVSFSRATSSRELCPFFPALGDTLGPTRGPMGAHALFFPVAHNSSARAARKLVLSIRVPECTVGPWRPSGPDNRQTVASLISSPGSKRKATPTFSFFLPRPRATPTRFERDSSHGYCSAVQLQCSGSRGDFHTRERTRRKRLCRNLCIRAATVCADDRDIGSEPSADFLLSIVLRAQLILHPPGALRSKDSFCPSSVSSSFWI